MSKIKHKLQFRHPTLSDGAKIWSMVKDSGKLDLNSPYFYLAMSHWFSQSCIVAEDIEQNRLVGVAIGFMQPTNKDTLFIWQVTVVDDYRGKGIALLLLDELARRSGCHYIEATISPSNASSKRLFEKLTLKNETAIVKKEGFGTEFFPNETHEQEDLYVIGPLKK